MTSENNFDEMYEGASSIVDEDLQINSGNDEVSSTYKCSQNLASKGYKYDDNGLYCPLNTTEKYYLKISRETSYTFTIGIYNEGIFEAKSLAFTSNKSICEEHGDRNKKLGQYANIINNSYDKGEKPFEKGAIASKLTEFAIDLLNEPDFSQINKDFKVYNNEVKESQASSDEEKDDIPQCSEDYDDFVKSESLALVESDSLFDKVKGSISLTHEGDNQLKDKLPLIFASPFVDIPIHTELDSETGKGKTDAIIESIKNFPSKYVHILGTISPKNIYYDKDSYNDDFNIVVFDDVVLTKDRIEVIKVLSDNNKPIKELRTVIDGKPIKFTLKGKFLVILTYAKSNPDKELLNRLYKLDIPIDKKEDENAKKHKVMNNSIINSDNNEIISRNRLFIQGAIHHLIEKKIVVFNPFNSMTNPIKMIHRDIKAFGSMVKSKTFYHSTHRKTIKINDIEITIGSYEDYIFVDKLWTDDGDSQKYKLNHRQKQILKVLPEMTRDEAYDMLDTFKEEFEKFDSKGARDKKKEELYTYKTLSKLLNINQDTLRNEMYKFNNDSTSETLYDKGLIDFIKYDEDNPKSPNIFFKVKNENEGETFDDESDYRYNRQIEFTDLINRFDYKIKIIKDILLSVDVLINKMGYVYIEKYCKMYNVKIEVDDYDSYYDFINSFFDDFDYDKYTIPLDEARQIDIEDCMSKSDEIDKAIFTKKEKVCSTSDNENLTDTKKPSENAQNHKDSSESIGDSKLPFKPIGKSDIKKLLEEKSIDVDVGYSIINALIDDDLTNFEIQRKLYPCPNPDDIDDAKVMKIEMTLKRLVDNSIISIKTSFGQVYHLEDEIRKLLEGDDD